MPALPSWTLPGSRPREKNGPAGLSVQKGERRLPPADGKNRAGGMTPAAAGRKPSRMCPRRPQEARVRALPPWTLPWEPPGRENGPAGLSGQKGGRAPRSPPAAFSHPGGSPRRHPEILERPRRRRETPENMAALALRGPRGRFPGRQASLPLGAAASPKGLKKAREGPERRPGPAHPRPPARMSRTTHRRGPPGTGRAPPSFSRPVRAEGPETRRSLQAAAFRPPPQPGQLPSCGADPPGRPGLTQGCGRSDRCQADNKTAAPLDAGSRPKGGNRTMTPAPPAERPHGPGKSPSRVPS